MTAPVPLLAEAIPTFAWVIFALAAIPAVMTLWNHLVFRAPTPADGTVPKPAISILIPARNEEQNIAAAVEGALAATGIALEVVVLDDGSTDRTAEIVHAIARKDDRVRLEAAPPLPAGWCGKQHACTRLAELARHDLLLFIDADVTLAPDAPGRLAAFLDRQGASLVSAFPRQETVTFLEKLLIPLIEFILLGYLPMQAGRWFRLSGFGAGCGQVFLAERKAYETAGGHAAIRTTLHDGVRLPRLFRKAGFHTDLCSGVGLIDCRMYRNAGEVWSGLLKNAHEGIANPGSILPFSILLAGGSIVPWAMTAWALFVPGSNIPAIMALAILALSLFPRTLNTIRFRQSPLGLVLHPVSVLLFLVIQWQSFFRLVAGRKPTWKGRSVG